MLRLNCMILSQNLNVGHVLLAVLQKHGNLKSNNTFYTPKVLIVKVDVLWTLYGATDSLLHVFRGSRKRFMILGSIKRTKLIKIKESFLQKDEISITIIIFSNKTLDIKSSSYIRNPFDPNIVSPECWSQKMSLHHIPWKNTTYSLWPSRQQPCNLATLAINFKSTLCYRA